MPPTNPKGVRSEHNRDTDRDITLDRKDKNFGVVHQKIEDQCDCQGDTPDHHKVECFINEVEYKPSSGTGEVGFPIQELYIGRVSATPQEFHSND